METSPQIKSKFPRAGTTIFSVMTALANEHEAINLAQGFPDFEPPAELIALKHRYMLEGKNQYAPMPGVLALREQISAKINRLYSIEYNPDTEITITAGATLALSCAIMCCLGDGDEAIIIEPAYDSYAPAVRMAGAKPVYCEIDLETMRVDWGAVKRLINYNTKAIIINTPHNPTGSILNAQDLIDLEKLVENHDIVVISDEVYEHIIFDGREHQSVARYPKLAKHSFIVSSFGKTYHATGWKMGYIVAPEKLMAEFRKIYQYVGFSAHSPSQYALAEYMKNDTWCAALPQFFTEKRDFFRHLLTDSRFKLLPCDGSYFQTVSYDKISQLNSLDMAKEMTINHKVASIPMASFYHQPFAGKYLRLCFAKSEETLKKGAERLCKI